MASTVSVEKEKWLEHWEKTPMRRPFIAKVTVNFGVGESGARLEKAKKVCEILTKQKPKEIKAKRTIRDFGIRKFEPIGCKVTLRGEKAKEFLRRVLEAKGNVLSPSSFDDQGNVSFGIREHIDVPGIRYDPGLGVFGFDVSVSIERPGFHIKKRHIRPKKLPKRHRVIKEEAFALMAEEFGIEISDKVIEEFW